MYPVVDEDNCLFWNSFKSAAYWWTTSEFKDISIGRVPSIDKVTLKQEYTESLIAKYLNLTLQTSLYKIKLYACCIENCDSTCHYYYARSEIISPSRFIGIM